MVGLAQMVRASDCGPEGRRFDPAIPPHLRLKSPISAFFLARSMTNRASLGENTDLKDFIT